MPRDISGNYTLPLGNPVVNGTLIEVGWANPTLSDIANQLNGVVTRDGLLFPTAAMRFASGSQASPGIQFSADTNTGMYRYASDQIGFSLGGATRVIFGLGAAVYASQAPGLFGYQSSVVENAIARAFNGLNTSAGAAAGASNELQSDVVTLKSTVFSSAHATYGPIAFLRTTTAHDLYFGTSDTIHAAFSSAASGEFQLYQVGNGLSHYVENAGGTNQWRLGNAGAVAGSNARLSIGVDNIDAGVPCISFEGNSGLTFWAVGLRNITGEEQWSVEEDGFVGTANSRMKIWPGGRVSFGNIHDNGTVTGTADQFLASGTYTPTLTNSTNVAASTAFPCRWTRVGNIVTVSGVCAIDVTAAVATVLDISLPIASNFTTANEGNGVANMSGWPYENAYMFSNQTLDTMSLAYIATVLTNVGWYFTFQYEIL